MSLTNPMALLWAGLAVPIVIFYILKIRMRRVPVSTVMFWQQVFEEKRPRSIWQRLRHLLSLLIQLLFLMLLVFALAEPFFQWQIQQAQRFVLVVDNSASMRATDVEPSRLARAKQEAEELVDSLRLHDEMAIVAAGNQPRVVCGLTGHQRTLRDTLRSIPETDGPTRVADAVALARRLVADHKNGKVIILSDGCFPKATKFAEAEDIVWVALGERTGNVGITQFQARRSLLDPVGYEILAEVTNFSEETVEVRFDIELEHEVVDVVPVKLEPEGTWSHVFEKTSAEGGRLVASLDRPDALMSDNEAQAILPQRDRQRVLLVTEGNVFLQKVFEANALVDLKVVSELPSQVPQDAIVVFHRTVPSPVPDGKVLVIDPTNATDMWELDEPLQNPIVAKQDKDSPLMAHVRLDNVLMPEARRLKMTGEVHVLAQSVSADPIYSVVSRPKGNLLVLTVNLDRGDLPLRTAFPILMSNALGWFAGTKGELRESLATGSVAKIGLLESAQPADSPGHSATANTVLQSPDGRALPLPNSETEVAIGPLDRCGVWRIARESGTPPDMTQLTQIACNLTNREESDLRVPEDLDTKQTIRTADFGGRPVWFYLVATAWLLMGVEWFLYQRRWIS